MIYHKMTDPELIYLLFSALVTFCIIYPPKEFDGAGLTIPKLFGRFFEHEFSNFILHHIVRTATTFVVWPSLPLFFLLFGYVQFEAQQESTIIPWSLGISIALLLPTIATFIVLRWSGNDWERHPIARLLRSYNRDWKQLVTEINDEYRSPGQIEVKLNSISWLIITENWIIKTLPLTIQLAQMDESELIVDDADVHNINEFGRDAIQYLTVRVKSTNPNRKGFTIRLKASDFQDIQTKLTRRIVLAPNVRLQPSLMDSFIAAFEELVARNPKFSFDVAQFDDSQCFACMTAEPNIKIKKSCVDFDEFGEELAEDDRCGHCQCRPMWCIGCLARWFAARQDEDHETWFEKKSPCPMCRTKFCILDVCYIEKEGEEE